ncbi:uncharacterized protein LOC141614026 [Silene latifolia]|uniref:uncharacterized protein LOC141614026 n=1 Tax=Silene latifolia TaxID=37657 RepID=UPI003D77D5C6
MEAFVDCLADCGMTDIHATGAYFTWTNKQDPEHRKYSRLDRFLINHDWLDEFPDMNAHFHPGGLMDHTPCIVRNIKLDGRRNASFKYFNMWGSAPEFHEIVQHTWSQQIVGSKMFGVVKKLKALKGELRKLNSSCFSDVELRANQAIINLEKIQLQIEEDYDRTDLIAVELQALEEVKYWSKARDSFLQQKAKTQWISEGDSNTAYFHSAIKSRCLRNKIVQIEDREASLLAPVTKEEIKGVVFAIPIDKAPGPDGYTSGFFRDSWDIVGDDICSAIMEFFTSGSMLNQINATNITLIPKCDRPTTCVRSTTFTLSLNGSNFGYFKGQRGLRQGDPISPLLFTICMEYLSRLIKFATDRWPFQYHPLCKNLKLTHLMFADDLLLFCKGKPQSIWLLMRAFSSFSKASGLAMNNAKSEIFFNGVAEDIKEGIKMVTGFKEGTMPFRYLGVPIKAGRLTKSECSALTEKMVARIRGLGAKKLSYAGRVTLINAVLNTLQNYWAQMFIIPKSIINNIMAICRNYLWDGSSEYHRVPLVAWDKVTLPKKEDRLWIKWVSDVYIKDHDWHCYTPPTDATWVWKNICKVKDKLKTGYANGSWTVSPKGYSIRSGYDCLSSDHIHLDWPAIMEHMFTSCVYAVKVQSCLAKWYGGGFPTVTDLIATQKDSIQWKVRVAVFNAVTYSIWYQRNNARVNDVLMRPEFVAARIEEDVKRRVKVKCGNVADQPGCGWLQIMGVN